MRKRRKATVEDGAAQTQNCEQGNYQEVTREQIEDRVFLHEDSPLPHPTQEEAGDNSSEKKGVQETTSPLSGQNSLGKSMTGHN